MELNGTAVNGTARTYELKVSEKADVKVSFTKDGASVTEYTVTVSAGSNGKVTVAPALPTDEKAPKGQELTITATAKSGSFAYLTHKICPRQQSTVCV